jgi:stage V sporulation protein K
MKRKDYNYSDNYLYHNHSNYQYNFQPKKSFKYIDVSANSLQDLINITDKYPYNPYYIYNIDLEGLRRIKRELKLLINMVGLDKLKESVFEQILYFIQGFNKDDYKHVVLYGPPGTGKTEVAELLGLIFSKIGILSNNVFKKVSRSELIAGFVGQTALKTKDVINQCLGGVLFIDEAYSLSGDTFSKECIDTICHEASLHKKDLMIIIAGYEEELKREFFGLNKGLDSRFVWRFEFTPYNASQLQDIFIKKINKEGWHIDIDNKILSEWFIKNFKKFKYYGRDIEVLFLKTKIAHSKRIFGKHKSFIKKISIEDLQKGFDMLLSGQQNDNTSYILQTMYI